MLGQRFKRLVVIEMGLKGPDGKARWRTLCDCGNEKVVRPRSLWNESTGSCGCLRRDLARTRNPTTETHGHTIGGVLSPTYQSWRAMKWRCSHPSDKDAPYYEGVVLDPRWLGREGFTNFLADMGERPPGLTLDRIDAAGDYTPSNCRWADAHTQRTNRRPGSAR